MKYTLTKHFSMHFCMSINHITVNVSTFNFSIMIKILFWTGKLFEGHFSIERKTRFGPYVPGGRPSFAIVVIRELKYVFISFGHDWHVW